MALNKLFHNRKAELTTQFLVSLVIAVIMILLVTAFMTDIWASILGKGGDKSSKSSFTALYSLMDSKARMDVDYDSSKINIYLADNYQIVYFGLSGSGQCQNLIRPSRCTDPSKECLCLYRDAPLADPAKKDQNVVDCKSFDIVMNVIDFELNDEIKVDDMETCKRKLGNYINLIVVGDKLRALSSKNAVHVWEDNADNRIKDQYAQRPRCKLGPSICFQLQDGVVVGSPSLTPTNQYQDVLNECKKQNIVAIEARCVMTDAATKTCALDCNYVNLDCTNKMKSCEYYNNYDSSGPISQVRKYFSNDLAPGKWLCENEPNVCGYDCDATGLMAVCKEGKTSECNAACSKDGGKTLDPACAALPANSGLFDIRHTCSTLATLLPEIIITP